MISRSRPGHEGRKLSQGWEGSRGGKTSCRGIGRGLGSTVAAEARLGKEVQGTVVKEQCICTQVKFRPVLAPTGISECILALGSQLGHETGPEHCSQCGQGQGQI